MTLTNDDCNALGDKQNTVERRERRLREFYVLGRGGFSRRSCVVISTFACIGLPDLVNIAASFVKKSLFGDCEYSHSGEEMARKSEAGEETAGRSFCEVTTNHGKVLFLCQGLAGQD